MLAKSIVTAHARNDNYIKLQKIFLFSLNRLSVAIVADQKMEILWLGALVLAATFQCNLQDRQGLWNKK